MQSSAPDPLIGAVLEGQFRVERLIGRGGMGRVYVAESQRLRRRCALKVLLPELTADPRCVERFLREGQAIAQIRHENVVDIHHLGEDPSGIVFYAMELLSGEDLASRLKRRDEQPLDWRAVTRWMLQIARAIVAVHAAGLIHRDLKPSNVFIARTPEGDRQIKLLDFGIVKADDQATLTGTGTVIGTASYMSPEQIQGERLDRRCDLYSFGVLFYEALAGRKPFSGEPLQVAYHHCHTPPPPLRPLAPDIPPELADLVMSMLAKDVGERIQTAEAIEQILREILAEKPSADSVMAPRREAPPAAAWVKPGAGVLRSAAAVPARHEAPVVATVHGERPAAGPERSVADAPAASVAPVAPVRGGRPAAGSERSVAAPTASVAPAAAPGGPRVPPPRASSAPVRAAAGPALGRRIAAWGTSVALVGFFVVGLTVVIRELTSGDTAATPEVEVALVGLPPPIEPVAAATVNAPAPESSPTASPSPGAPVLAEEERRPGASSRSPSTGAPISTAAAPARDAAKAAELATRGASALVAGRRSEAEELFNRALNLDRKCDRALIGLSDIAFDRGSTQQAQAHAERAVSIAPNQSDYRLKLGDAYFKGARYADALAQYEAARQLGNAKATQRVEKARARLAAEKRPG